MFGSGGVVATGHPLASSAGLAVLRAGGNAVDAAVAAGLVSAVVLPEMCGLGGDLFAVLHGPTGTHSVQGSGIAPRSLTLDQLRAAGSARSRGPLSVAVPGMVDAYFTLLSQFGTRSFAELVEPAIAYAEGHPITPERIVYIDRFASLLREYPSSAAVFLPDGRVPLPGEVLRQPDLASTLRLLASGGRDVFYRGEISERIGTSMASIGGALSADDLATQATEITTPISTTYRGHTVYETCLPSQGQIVLEALNILESFDLSLGSAEAVHLQVEAVKLAFADRHAYAKDPAFGPSPVDELLSKDWAARRAASIGTKASDDLPPGEFDRGDTSYLCVIDGNGTMVSLIQSVAANFGSGIVAGDTGVVLNNRASAFSLDPAHPNVFEPGKKTVHTLNAYLVADPGGTPVLVGGTPGGDRQPQWNVQFLTGLIDGGWDVQQTLEQPTWISSVGSGSARTANGFTLDLEARFGTSVARELEERGHRVTVGPDFTPESSVGQQIARNPTTGILAGGTDPRSEGAVLAF